MLNRITIFFALASIVFTNYGHADLVVTVSSITTTANSTVTTTVSVADDDGAAGGVASLEGYNIPLDIGNDGIFTALPAGLSFANPANPAVPGSAFGGANYIPNTTGLPFDFDGNVSFSFTDGSSVDLSTTPITLFSIDFNVAASLPASTVFDISIVNSVVPGSISFAGPNLGTPLETPGALGAGVIDLGGAAIPEPSTMVLGILSLGGLMLRRRRN